MEENRKVVYKQKKSTGKTVTIVILIILLLSLLAYIGYDKYKEQEKNISKSKDVKRTELYYREVEDIMEQIDMYNYVFKDVSKIEDIHNIDNQLKLQFGIYALQEVENIHNYYQVEDIKEMYNNYFVSGFNAVFEDIDCPAKDKPLYAYDSDKKTFKEVDGHEHGNTTFDIDTYFVKGEIEGNHYIITTHILYSNYCNGTCNPNGGYYQTYDDLVEGTNPVTYQRNEYKEIKDELKETTYTFIKDKERYKLESIESNL